MKEKNMPYNHTSGWCEFSAWTDGLNLEKTFSAKSEIKLKFFVAKIKKNLLTNFFIDIDLSIKQKLRLKLKKQSSKARLALILLLLMPYSFTIQALSASTVNTIQGTAPYLTFDGGTTKVTTTSGLLGIKLSDGSTPVPNSLTPISLPAAGQTFADIEMLVPSTTPPVSATDPTQTITLNDLIGAPYNYWGDDDGDGLGASGITITGSLSVVITDKNGTKVNRSDIPSTCSSPYQVVLSSTDGSLQTQYGDPSSSAFTASNATYLINPATGPAVCFAKPDMLYARGRYAGPTSMWDGGTTGGGTTQSNGKGFITQSTTPATYGNNFPTTGANGLYFDLDIGGSASALTWDQKTENGITATMTAASPTSVRVTLTGPTETTTPQLPSGTFATAGSTFELEGKSGGTTVVKYGFTIKKWYVNRDSTTATVANQAKWCKDMGYRQSKVSDLTNASGIDAGNAGTIPGATPSSGGNYYSRYIGTGLFSEWGRMVNYTGAGFKVSNYWTSDVTGTAQLYANSNTGGVNSDTNPARISYAVCTYP